MLKPSSVTFRVAIAAILAIVALVAFNVTYGNVQSDLEVSFNQWYDQAVPVLEHNSGTEQTPVTVHVRLINPPAGTDNADWSLVSNGADSSESRARVARVLQLIRESNVFGLSPVTAPQPGVTYASFSVVQQGSTFETVVPYAEVTENVRLQNLLKLLEVFASTQPNVVNPARL